MELTPIDVLNMKFQRKMRGYDPDQVDAFMKSAANGIERLIVENSELKERVEGLEGEVKRYREMENTLNNALVLAQKTADETHTNARKEAELIIREAKQEAERRIDELRAECESLKMARDRFQAEFRALLNTCLEICEGSASAGRPEQPSE